MLKRDLKVGDMSRYVNAAIVAGEKFRSDVDKLTSVYIDEIKAYLDSCIGKRIKHVEFQHPMDGEILKGYSQIVCPDIDIHIVGRIHQPIVVDIEWTLLFESGIARIFHEDMFGKFKFE